MKNQNVVVWCLVTAVVVGGVGFWGGNMYAQNQRTNRFAQMGNRTGNIQNANGGIRGANGSAQPGAGMMRGGAVVGEVTAKDDKSITVKMTDGSSRIVILSGSTAYRISNESTLDEVAVGKTIAVQGTPNSDGSTTATSIELNPVMHELQGNNK